MRIELRSSENPSSTPNRWAKLYQENTLKALLLCVPCLVGSCLCLPNSFSSLPSCFHIAKIVLRLTMELREDLGIKECLSSRTAGVQHLLDPVHTVLGTKHGVSCVLGKHSTNFSVFSVLLPSSFPISEYNVNHMLIPLLGARGI